jgi:hypothetical protein
VLDLLPTLVLVLAVLLLMGICAVALGEQREMITLTMALAIQVLMLTVGMGVAVVRTKGGVDMMNMPEKVAMFEIAVVLFLPLPLHAPGHPDNPTLPPCNRGDAVWSFSYVLTAKRI